MHAHEEPTTHENVTHTNQHHDMGPGDKEEDDQHIPPLPTEVVTAQLPPPSPIKKLVFKYHVRGPPPPTKEVSLEGRMSDDVLMVGTPGDRDREAPGDEQQGGGKLSLLQQRRTCVYSKGGVCGEHGPGATEKWKPTNTIGVGKDGKKTIKNGRKYFCVCDTGLGNKKLKQTMLSFQKTTPVSKDNIPPVPDIGNLNKGERFRDFVENITLSRGQQQQQHDCVNIDVTTRESVGDEKRNSR